MTLTLLWPLMRAALAESGPVGQAFLAPLPVTPDLQTPPPVPVGLARPAPEGLAKLAEAASPSTRGLAAAIAGQAAALVWRSSYSAAEVGDFARGYAWAPLGSPEGPLVCAAGLVSVMYVGPGLAYPPHRHAPEEVYLVLCGEADFRSETQPARRLGPGGLCHHAPQESHAMQTSGSPVLVLSVWRGGYSKSELAGKAA